MNSKVLRIGRAYQWKPEMFGRVDALIEAGLMIAKDAIAQIAEELGVNTGTFSSAYYAHQSCTKWDPTIFSTIDQYVKEQDCTIKAAITEWAKTINRSARSLEKAYYAYKKRQRAAEEQQAPEQQAPEERTLTRTKPAPKEATLAERLESLRVNMNRTVSSITDSMNRTVSSVTDSIHKLQADVDTLVEDVTILENWAISTLQLKKKLLVTVDERYNVTQVKRQ